MSEELKAIVEVIGNLGEEGSRVFLIYLWVGVLKVILIIALAAFIVSTAARLIRWSIGTDRLEDCVNRGLDKRDRMSLSQCIQMAIDSKFWENR